MELKAGTSIDALSSSGQANVVQAEKICDQAAKLTYVHTKWADQNRLV